MKAQMSWTPIYLVIIVAIAAILLTAVIKPMFQSAGEYALMELAFLFF